MTTIIDLKQSNYPKITIWVLMGNEKQSKQLVKWRKIKVSMAPHSSTLAWKIPWMEPKDGESQGRGSLVDCRLWGRTESDTTEAT